MTWRTVESFLLGKADDPALCEDGVLTSDDYVAVVDGATAKTETKFGGHTPGRAAANSIIESLERLSSGVDAKCAIETLNADLLKRIAASNPSLTGVGERPTASMAIVSQSREELWLLGDCAALIDGQLHCHVKQLDEVMAAFRAAVLEGEILAGAKVAELQADDPGRAAIMPMLRKQFVFQNNVVAGRLAYGALDGSNDCISFAEVIDISGATQIILASDGYPRVCATLAESERAVATVIAKDPLMIREVPSTKGVRPGHLSFDDRAYIRLER